MGGLAAGQMICRRVCASLFSLSISFVNWAGRLSYLLTNLETVFFALFLFLSS